MSDRPYRSREWLHEKYVEDEMTQAEIGDICGVCTGTIQHWVSKFEFETGWSSSKEEVLTDLREVCVSLGRAPSKSEYDELGGYSLNTPVRHFASWSAACQKAGFEVNQEGGQWLPEEAILDDLRELADKLGHTPSVPEYDEHGEYSQRPFMNRYGTWRAACEAADLDPNAGPTDRDEVLKDYKRVADKVGGTPTQPQYAELGSFDKDTVIRHFESWNDAARVADLEPNEAFRGTGDDRLGDEEWLAEQYRSGRSLLSIAGQLGCNDDAVRYRLRSYGVDMRSRSETRVHSEALGEEVDSNVERAFARALRDHGILADAKYHPTPVVTCEGRWEPDFLVRGWYVECKNGDLGGAMGGEPYSQTGRIARCPAPVLLFGTEGDAEHLPHDRFVEYVPGEVPDLTGEFIVQRRP